MTEPRTDPCIRCGTPLLECIDRCCDDHDHPYATIRETVEALWKDIEDAEDRAAAASRPISTEPEGLREALTTFFEVWDNEPPFNVPDAVERLRAALAIQSRGLDAHPGEPHEFRTACQRCGEPGYLNVALITPNERVEIAAATQAPETEGEPG